MKRNRSFYRDVAQLAVPVALELVQKGRAGTEFFGTQKTRGKPGKTDGRRKTRG